MKGANGPLDREVEVETARNLEDNIKELINSSGGDHIYVSIPKVNLDTIIADNKDVHDYIDESFRGDSERWKNEIERRTEHTRYNRSTQEFETIKLSDNIFEDVDKEFYKFKNNAKKEVSYLVKEFECKKSADAYARSSTARTGVLDTSKLHTYKYNEDLFKKVTVVIAKGNHDTDSSSVIRIGVSLAYRDEPRVTVLDSDGFYNYVEYGS